MIDTVDTQSVTWKNIAPPVVDFASKLMIVMRDLKVVLGETLSKTSHLSRTFQLKLTDIERHIKNYDETFEKNIKDIKRKNSDDTMKNRKMVTDLIKNNRETDYDHTLEGADKMVDNKLKTKLP